MKINKILAAGVAATLAVTSLSAVASAEVKERSFDMDYTFSNVSWKNVKTQWFGDNEDQYIGTKAYGAAATAKALVNKIAADAAPAAGTRPATAAPVADVKTLAELYVFTAGAPSTAAVGATATAAGVLGNTWSNGASAALVARNGGAIAATLSDTALGAVITAAQETALSKAETDVNAQLAKAFTAINAAFTGANNADEGAYSAEKTVGDIKLAAESLSLAAKKMAALEAAVTATGDANAAAIVEDIEDQKELLEKAVVELKDRATLAEEALLGEPLLDQREVAGMWITKSAIPLVAGETDIGDKYVKITGAKLIIKGTKRGTNTNDGFDCSFVDSYNAFTNHIGTGNSAGYYIAFSPKAINRPGYYNLNVLGTITDAELDLSYDLYYKTGENADGTPIVGKAAYFDQTSYDGNKSTKDRVLKACAEAGGIKYYDALDIDDVFADDLHENEFVTYAAVGAETEATNVRKFFKVMHHSVLPNNDITDDGSSKVTKYPQVFMTTDTKGATVFRDDVLPLSVTGAHKSYTYDAVNGINYDTNQSFYTDTLLGDAPYMFGGFAGQCADFFNHQNNGTITFKFADPAKVTTWVSNGIPSTEVGLRTALAGTTMALFFNYQNTTGSINSLGTVDADALTITFDMAEVLDDFGDLTKGTLHDIYYGLNTGVKYGDPYVKDVLGYVIEKVTLAYDDAPAAVDATTDDDTADDDAAVVVADDDDDDDIAADDDIIEDDDDDDDDAGEIIADDDDDDDDVNNEVDYVDGDDDANPGTGVGLAVIPAIVAAAAVAVSKKRK